jgi:hypothetical protein
MIKKVNLYPPLSALVLLFAVVHGFPQGTFQPGLSGSVLLPSEAPNVEGDSAKIPFVDTINSSGRPFRTQQFIQNIGGLPATGVFLTGVSFRYDTERNGIPSAFQEHFTDLQITLATPTGGLSEDFDRNLGPSSVRVFSGPLVFTVHPVLRGQPAAFDIVIPFQTPFLYTPGQMLLLDMQQQGPDPIRVDFFSGAAGIYTEQLVPRPLSFGGMLAMEVAYAVPEPTTGILCFLGLVCICQRRGKTKEDQCRC